MPTVDIGSDTYPSFTDLDAATLFLAADVERAAGWAARNPDAQGRGLASATRMLQRLSWCTDPAPDPTDVDIPAVIAEVTAMLAADLLAKPRLFSDAGTNSNIKSVKAGSANVDFFSPVKGGPPLPRALWDQLVSANLVGCTDSNDQTGTPYVSGILGPCRPPLGGRDYDDWPWTSLDYD